jgi:hypothetical protein
MCSVHEYKYTQCKADPKHTFQELEKCEERLEDDAEFCPEDQWIFQRLSKSTARLLCIECPEVGIKYILAPRRWGGKCQIEIKSESDRDPQSPSVAFRFLPRSTCTSSSYLSINNLYCHWGQFPAFPVSTYNREIPWPNINHSTLRRNLTTLDIVRGRSYWGETSCILKSSRSQHIKAESKSVQQYMSRCMRNNYPIANRTLRTKQRCPSVWEKESPYLGDPASPSPAPKISPFKYFLHLPPFGKLWVRRIKCRW